MNKIGDKAVVWIDCLRDEFREVPQVYKNLGPKTDKDSGRLGCSNFSFFSGR